MVTDKEALYQLLWGQAWLGSPEQCLRTAVRFAAQRATAWHQELHAVGFFKYCIGMPKSGVLSQSIALLHGSTIPSAIFVAAGLWNLDSQKDSQT